MRLLELKLEMVEERCFRLSSTANLSIGSYVMLCYVEFIYRRQFTIL